MKNIDPVVKKETKYISLWVLILSLLMQAVFLILGKWSLTVLWGNLLGGGTAILNFFLMGLGVQKAVQKEEKDAKATLRLSQSYRFLLLILVAIFGFALEIFHSVAVILPLFFPRIAVGIRPFLDKKSIK